MAMRHYWDSFGLLLATGHVMVREAPKDIPKNGKRYHIHTFGCQVS